MAYSHVTYTGNGTTTDYTYSFGYISTSHIKVTVNGTTTTAYSWFSPTVIRFTTAPASAAVIRISRSTSPGTKLVTFDTGTTMTKTVMETDSKQAFYLAQETIDNENSNLLMDSADGKWDAQSAIIKNLATPTANTDAATKKYADDVAAAMVIAAGEGTVVGQSTTVVGNIATWANTTGTQITDSGTTLAAALTEYVQGTGTLTVGNVPKINANRIVDDSGVVAANLVTSASAATAANQVMLANATSSRAAKFLANGSNDQTLTIVSGVPTWKTPGATAGQGMVLLAVSSLSATTVDFALPSTYSSFMMVGRAGTATTSPMPSVKLYLRSDSANVGSHWYAGSTTTVADMSGWFFGRVTGFTVWFTGVSGSHWTCLSEVVQRYDAACTGTSVYSGSYNPSVGVTTLRMVLTSAMSEYSEVRLYALAAS